MFSGIRIPKFFGGRRHRITQLLKEGERLSSEELKREEVLGGLFDYFSHFIEESNVAKIEKELEEQLGVKEKKEVLTPYFFSILNTLLKMKNIILYLDELNKKLLENAVQIKSLVDEHNRSTWPLIPMDERVYFFDFQKICNKRYEEINAIDNLYNFVIEHINRMIVITRKGIDDLDSIDHETILEFLNMEKQVFLEISKEELKKLKFETETLKDITQLENLNQFVFGKKFLNKGKEARTIGRRNKSLRLIAASYIMIVHIGLQTIAPAFFASYQIPTWSTIEYHEMKKEYTKVKFYSTEYKKNISGIFIKNPNYVDHKGIKNDKLMILVHGRSANATRLLPYCEKLLPQTINDCFILNLEKHGVDSTDGFFRSSSLGAKGEITDVLAAIKYFSDKDYKEIVLYGHSISGAAVLNAVDLLSNKILIRGIIVEKTYANLREFLYKGHGELFSNMFFPNVVAAYAFKGFPPKVLPTSREQRNLSIKLTEKLGGFKSSDSDPSEIIKRINVPVMIIGNEGDIFTKPSYADKLEENAKYPYKVIVHDKDKSLIRRHDPETDNDSLIIKMAVFINKVFSKPF